MTTRPNLCSLMPFEAPLSMGFGAFGEKTPENSNGLQSQFDSNL